MFTAHKTKLMPNTKQRTYFKKAAGVARFAYNWALDEWLAMWKAKKEDPSLPSPNEGLLRKKLNAIKGEKFPWMYEVTKCAPQQAIKNLGIAFKRFFEGKSRYPHKKKKYVYDSFYLDNCQFDVEGNKVFIAKLGWVRMAEPFRFKGKLVSATISLTADDWFVSIAVETEKAPSLTTSKEIVGVDLGISALATLSTGEKIIGPKPRKRLLKRIKRLNRRLSKKKKHSKNRAKAKTKLARLHARIANIRMDATHKLTTGLVRRFGTIVIEDLSVKNMMKNHHLAGAISDMAWGEFRRQLEYKAERHGVKLVVVNRWFASSKTCRYCGCKLEKLDLSVRKWNCPVCGEKHDRDINAAINLKNAALEEVCSQIKHLPIRANPTESSAVAVCGATSSGLAHDGFGETGRNEAESINL